MSSPFDIIKDINKGVVSEDISDYNPWLTNINFSLFPDTLYHANIMNMNHGLDPKYQYYYMINTIRPQNRYQKWPKKSKEEEYEAVKNYFSFSDRKTREALRVLTKEQVRVIVEKEEQKGD